MLMEGVNECGTVIAAGTTAGLADQIENIFQRNQAAQLMKGPPTWPRHFVALGCNDRTAGQVRQARRKVLQDRRKLELATISIFLRSINRWRHRRRGLLCGENQKGGRFYDRADQAAASFTITAEGLDE